MSSSSRHRRPSEDLGCKVYIGGLGNSADSQEIETAFAAFGRVQNVWVARNPPGFAFVAFEDPRDADDAVRCLDGTKLNGKRVRVEKSSGESRWEKWKLSPPVSASSHGVTLDYKDIKEAILLRKQLRLSRRVLGRGSSREHLDSKSSSSPDSRTRHRRHRSGTDRYRSDSGSEILRLAEHVGHREKFTRERRSLDRSRSRSGRRRSRSERTPRRTRCDRARTRRQRYFRRSYGSSSSRSSSVRMRFSSERNRPLKRLQSGSRSRSKTNRKKNGETKDGLVLPTGTRDSAGNGSEYKTANEPENETAKENKRVNETGKLSKTASESNTANESKTGNEGKTGNESGNVTKLCTLKTCSCMAAISKAEMVNAQTQTEVVSRKTVGVQCQRKLEPLRRLATKRVTKATDMTSSATAMKGKGVKDGAEKETDAVRQDGVAVM